MAKAAIEKNVTSSSLDIHLLGLFRVAVDGIPVDERRWARRKPKLLVKLLALQPHHQLHREQAMELLWPDSEPESSINNLHKAIHLARHALEPELEVAADSHFILTKGQQIVLAAPAKLWVDVNAFEQAAALALKGEDQGDYEAALLLCGGDLLAEDIYQDWAALRREQLRGTYQILLQKFAGLLEVRGEYQPAIERLRQLVASDPGNEEAHRQLMRLYAVTGQRQQALRQYKECCDTLRRELEAEPEPATSELHEEIRAARIKPRPGVKASVPPRDTAINSLAVLPLVNASADPGLEYFSDGITESIINNLSQLPQLKVMARSTVFRYKEREIDPQAIGRQLGVRAVLTGRVSLHGGSFNIQTELVDVADGSQLWGELYSRKSADIFEVQEEIAREITGKLRLRLSGEEKGRLTKRYTENTEAHLLYLKGRYHWNKRTREALKKGIECFRQAIKIDPAYAAAYAGLADCYAKLGDVGSPTMPSKEAFFKGKMAAIKALEIDGTLAEAHTSLAHLHMHAYEWPEAQKEFKLAFELNPNYATAHHWYAYCLLLVGRPDEALTEIARALDLDPLSLPINESFGEILYLARQYDQAFEQLQKTLEMDPQYVLARGNLGRVYEQKRMYKEAVAEFHKVKEFSEDKVDVLASLAHTLAISGEREEASTVLARLKELSKRKYVSPYNIALVHLGLGEQDKAFEWLERGYREGAEWMIFLSVDPRFDSLRADSRFKQLLRRIGFAS